MNLLFILLLYLNYEKNIKNIISELYEIDESLKDKEKNL